MTFGGLPARWEPAGASRGLALVLPGRAYPPSAPLLDLARRAFLRHGFTVREVWWDSTSRTEAEVAAPEPWVRRQAEAALADEDAERVVVVGKSLGTNAASYACERGLDAVWLTPLLVDPVLADGIGRSSGRQLLVGGSADAWWDSAVAARLRGPRCDVLELPDADHGLCVDDVVRTAELHVAVARALDGFLAGL
ncbi:MAG: hypothetical protein AVDCRST_MAG32-2334 [uncultured Nocardioides sp.]|uniref:Alpha/beta hydrolase n=1 Tax=uncultured Nocardioides sp. TaxID=198441 RepID=A0A6J4NNM6_9ACTN|nr:MAG: hypothetical protein AVDCRST_MAG32-2334 [uncultured Nocardioides sp.]